MPNPYPVKIKAGGDEGPVVVDGVADFVNPGNQPGGVSSVFGRTGAVHASAGDYIAAQVTDAEDTANKGAANGYAGLGATGKVPVAQLPVAVANGVAGLGATAKLPLAQLATDQAGYNGNNVNINNGVSAVVTWDTQGGGAALLDISTPAAPTFVDAGLYAVLVELQGFALTVGGFFAAFLTIQGPSIGFSVVTDSRVATAAAASPRVVVSAVIKVAAGASLGAEVQNLDGVAARNFALAVGFVQRIA